MAKAKMRSSLGSWAFLIGLVIAVIVGFFGSVGTTMGWVLVILGLIVGLLNIAEKEVQSYLLAGTVLVILASFGAGVFAAVAPLDTVLTALLFLFVPSTVIVALKYVFTLARA
ncbi:MAG: hypothetical protein KJ767_00310 [Nanoarchaeota archaeon]|nr:hypothetical protein [Nanoarchaeota archaeon]